ncbi:MAG: type III pantothenate kinase [Alphaproteobacteria bacterium]|nr:type III pantothenate kinase [Alphaproteobacteria bacterium]
MLLCLDVGNTHIFGGVFRDDKIVLRFRYATHQLGTSDQFGIFLRDILQLNKLDSSDVTAVAMCSVVPACNYTINHAISQYFGVEVFNLKAGVRTGLNIRYKNPAEVGADRIANAIGVVNAFPDKNIIIIDEGTATTFCAVNKKKDYLGGVILAGMRLSMEALSSNAAKLMEVDIKVPPTHLGQTTRGSVQRGLYFGHLGALREIVSGLKKETFNGETVTVIGTGGFSQLFRDEKIFDIILPDLVLQGLRIAYNYSLESMQKVKSVGSSA